jgi:hypothetical protein
MITSLADERAREIGRQMAQSKTRGRRPGSREAHSAATWPGVRRRLGFGLVEAGLHVLATTRPAP